MGYWLGKAFLGQGLATRAVLEYLFAEETLHRVGVQGGVANRRSPALPERLGFTHEGTRRQPFKMPSVNRPTTFQPAATAPDSMPPV